MPGTISISGNSNVALQSLIHCTSDAANSTERLASGNKFVGAGEGVDQINNNANFEYNGMTLLNGTYSGEALLSTNQGQKVIYDINDIEQIVANGSFGENRLFEQGSKIEVSANMGKTRASATIDLSAIAKGDVITVNGREFTMVSSITDSATQFTDVANLTATLQASEFTEVNQASYETSGADLAVTYNQAGFTGETLS